MGVNGSVKSAGSARSTAVGIEGLIGGLADCGLVGTHAQVIVRGKIENGSDVGVGCGCCLSLLELLLFASRQGPGRGGRACLVVVGFATGLRCCRRITDADIHPRSMNLVDHHPSLFLFDTIASIAALLLLLGRQWRPTAQFPFAQQFFFFLGRQEFFRFAPILGAGNENVQNAQNQGGFHQHVNGIVLDQIPPPVTVECGKVVNLL
mmetsp:Transcript_4249/g.8912  ORF Transcript_4249/g.8912 Transcript_4249/m.8912 type:complete len:207 (+) Transcript_4249:1166-1786(+)